MSRGARVGSSDGLSSAPAEGPGPFRGSARLRGARASAAGGLGALSSARHVSPASQEGGARAWSRRPVPAASSSGARAFKPSLGLSAGRLRPRSLPSRRHRALDGGGGCTGAARPAPTRRPATHEPNKQLRLRRPRPGRRPRASGYPTRLPPAEGARGVQCLLTERPEVVIPSETSCRRTVASQKK